MPGLYSITTRATGTILTAAIYNADHQNHVNNFIPQMEDHYSHGQAQMQTQTDPGTVGGESFPVSLAGELERIRFVLAKLGGQTIWYAKPGVAAAGQSPIVSADGSGFTLAVPYKGFKNRIQNGAMLIDQRNAGAVYTANNSGNTRVLDRWSIASFGAANNGVLNAGQNVLVPPATPFVFSLGLSVVTQRTGPAAADLFEISQVLEGFDTADLLFGTASAASITLQFWVYSSVTGLYGVGITNGAQNRSYVATYTINAANTWQLITITIPGDTAGVWNVNNLAGLGLIFDLGSGSNYEGIAGWQAGLFFRTSTCVHFAQNVNGSTFYITGVQIEAGAVATAFEVRSFAQELALCERHLQKSYDIGTAVSTVIGSPIDVGVAPLPAAAYITRIPWSFKSRMRVGATMLFYSPVSGALGSLYSRGAAADVAIGAFGGTQTGFFVECSLPAGTTDTRVTFHYAADSSLS